MISGALFRYQPSCVPKRRDDMMKGGIVVCYEHRILRWLYHVDGRLSCNVVNSWQLFNSITVLMYLCSTCRAMMLRNHLYMNEENGLGR